MLNIEEMKEKISEIKEKLQDIDTKKAKLETIREDFNRKNDEFLEEYKDILDGVSDNPFKVKQKDREQSKLNIYRESIDKNEELIKEDEKAIEQEFKDYISNLRQDVNEEKAKIQKEAEHSSIEELQDKKESLAKEKQKHLEVIKNWEEHNINPNDVIYRRLKDKLVPEIDDKIAKIDRTIEELDPVNLEKQYEELERIGYVLNNMHDMSHKIEELIDTLGIKENSEQEQDENDEPVPEPEPELEPVPEPETDVTPEELDLQRELRNSVEPYIQETRQPNQTSENNAIQDKISIKMGRQAKITINGKTFKASKKSVKVGLNIYERHLIEKMRRTIKTSTIEKILGNEEDIEEYMKKGIADPAVINSILDAPKLSFEDRSKIIENYCLECMNPTNKNNIEVLYDLKDLSKTNIFSRLFKSEVNNEEKFKIMNKATIAERYGIGKKDGNYKPGIISRLISKITKDPIKQMPTIEQMQEAATMYNKLRDEEKTNKIKDSKFISDLQVSDQVKQELVELGKSMEIQNEQSRQSQPAPEQIFSYD